VKILYLSFSDLDHSVNAVYIKGLEANGVEVVKFGSKQPGAKRFLDAANFYFANRKNVKFILVGYDSPGLATWLYIISGKKIVYNALCSVYERLIISRSLASRVSPKAFYYWLLDFLACHMSRLVMVESKHQADFFSKFFKLSKQKLFVARSGVDEIKFQYNPNIKKAEEFTVIFRGRLLPEAGAEYAVKAAKLLEGRGVKIIMHGFGQELPKIQKLIEKLQPNNLQLVTDFLSFEDLQKLMQSAHLSLGQLSDHDRLQRTIPHKAYESLALKIPYLTARNLGVMELLRENETCLVFKPADERDLAAKILWAKEHPEELKRIAENAYQVYQTNLTAKNLAMKFLNSLA
jgi:glycosyltransferase involved in cell wall biosynthesis